MDSIPFSDSVGSILMHQPDTRLKREISKYMLELEARNLNPGHVKQTRNVLLDFAQFCFSRGVKCVRKVEPEDIAGWLKQFEFKSASYHHSQYSRVRGLMIHYDNASALRFKVRNSGYSRQRVDWLTPTETEAILATPMTVREAVLIRGGLLQGMRRIELVRMTVADVTKALETRTLVIRGKGGKARSVPIHPGFADALRAYFDAKDRGPGDKLLDVGEARAYGIVVEFSLRFGRRFSTHTLRRSFGRNLWLRGIPIETISELMGHKSTDMTRLYLGLNITDMRKAISEYGTKSELVIIEDVPQRRIAPLRLPEPEPVPLQA